MRPSGRTDGAYGGAALSTPGTLWSEGRREAPQGADYWACLASGDRATPPGRKYRGIMLLKLFDIIYGKCCVKEKPSSFVLHITKQSPHLPGHNT